MTPREAYELYRREELSWDELKEFVQHQYIREYERRRDEKPPDEREA